MAEAIDSKPIKCGFKSHPNYQLLTKWGKMLSKLKDIFSIVRITLNYFITTISGYVLYNSFDMNQEWYIKLYSFMILFYTLKVSVESVNRYKDR